MEYPPVYPLRPPQHKKIDKYLPYLEQRWSEGCHNARLLYREISQRGYDGAETRVREAVRPWREGKTVPVKQPSLGTLVMRPVEQLDAEQQERLSRYLEDNPMLARGYHLKEWFHDLVRRRDTQGLECWLDEAAESGLTPFQRVARSIVSDYQAVRHALEMSWSTGQCEGQICRVKLIKRMGYGRAKPDLLRKRILHRVSSY